jgi:hypothetical protein
VIGGAWVVAVHGQCLGLGGALVACAGPVAWVLGGVVVIDGLGGVVAWVA